MEQMMNVEKIRAFMAKQQPKAHPIQGHPLADMEDYVRRQYMDMLCVFAQYENKGTETAGSFIARLMAGAGMQEPVTDHIKNAMELTVEKFEEFLRICEENNFQKFFFMDAILVSCAGGTPERKQIELLAELAEILKIDKTWVQRLSKLAFAILMQSEEEFAAIRQGFTSQMYYDLIFPFDFYLKDFSSGLVFNSEDILWVHLFKRNPFNLTAYFDECGIITGGGKINSKTIILENIELHAFYRYFCLFAGAETVKMKNCSIKNWFFNFPVATSIHLEQCEFTMDGNFTDSLIEIETQKKFEVRIDSCYFHNICTAANVPDNSLFKHDYFPVFYISRSRFQNITKNDRLAQGVTILYNSEVHLENCEFINCIGNLGLFYECDIKKNQNCKFENCSKLQ